MIIVIDPGIRGCGVSLWSGDKTLQRAAYVPSPRVRGRDVDACIAMACAVRVWARGNHVSHMVCEVPRLLPAAQQKGDQMDLPPLFGVDCALGAKLDVNVTQYFPSEWKGQLDTETQMWPRAEKRLSAEEISRIEWPVTSRSRSEFGHLGHNVMDAVGIGLHHLGRFKRTRIYPG